MPILGSCCFCFDLKVGSTIIGVLNLIGALINSLGFAILLVMMRLFTAGSRKLVETHPAFSEDDDYQDLQQQQQKEMMEIVLDHVDAVTIGLYILLGLSLLSVITSSMLIHGVRRKRRGLLLPFVVQEFLNIIILLTVAIAALVILGTHQIVVSSAISVVVGLLFHLYFMLVIISQYQALGLIRMHEEISMK